MSDTPHVEEKYNWLLHFLVDDTGFPSDWYQASSVYPWWFVEDIGFLLWETAAQEETLEDCVAFAAAELDLAE